MSEDELRVALGSEIFDADGRKLGIVRGFDEDGFFVTTRDGVDALSVEHARAGHEFGEAELMWRCTECGEMGDLQDYTEGLPAECPNCGAPREDIYYWIED